MKIKPLREDLLEYLEAHHLQKKWEKASRFFEIDIRYPSLNTELLEPHWRGIYSFRLDNKYRTLFFLTSNGEAEVFQITNHYKK
jgi:plasmid maintenance system killer protein